MKFIKCEKELPAPGVTVLCTFATHTGTLTAYDNGWSFSFDTLNWSDIFITNSKDLRFSEMSWVKHKYTYLDIEALALKKYPIDCKTEDHGDLNKNKRNIWLDGFKTAIL